MKWLRCGFSIITNFIPIVIIQYEQYAGSAERVPLAVSDNRLKIPSAIQTGFRSVFQVRLKGARVKMAINLTTNQRVAIKILN